MPGAKRIPLRRHDGTIRALALVDAEDFEWLTQWRWHLAGNGYATRNVPLPSGKQYPVRMHRQLLGLERGDPRQGEHRNRDRLDCRRGNLRIAERGMKDNLQNVGSHACSSSRYRGVSWHGQTRKWAARVILDGKAHWLGVFANEAEAAAVASAWRAEHMPFSEDAALAVAR
jgi:hypothetical protein